MIDASAITASGTCYNRYQMKMLRLSDTQQQEHQQQDQQQMQPPLHHHQEQTSHRQNYHPDDNDNHNDEHQLHQKRQQQKQQLQQHQENVKSHWSMDTKCRNAIANRIHCVHKHLIIALCLLFPVSTAQANPRILVHPSDRSVAENCTVVLNCTIADRGDGQVQWTQNGFGLGVDRDMPGFNRYSMIGVEQGSIGEYNLQIRDVKLEDEGEYDCQVTPFTGFAGLMSNKARLEVVVPPRAVYIVKQTRNIPVVLHQPTEILCRADGAKPAPTITWHINGQRITRGVSTRSTPAGLVVNATGVLMFNATHDDAAKRIECQASSQIMSSPKRVQANLDVQFPPNITMSYNVSTRNIREHDHVRFQCSFFANPSDVTWKWFKNNKRIQGARGNVLHIRNIDPTFNGAVISCVGTNSIGATRIRQTLNVEYGPRITHITPFKGANLGESVELTCEVDGNPTPSIIWRRKVKGRHPHGALTTQKVYRVERVNEQTFGHYVCMATVSGFRDESKEAIIVRNSPPQAMSKKTQEAEVGERATLECEVTSVPEPTEVQWLRQGVPITTDVLSDRFKTGKKENLYQISYFLTITIVKSEDFGYYNCSVKNEYGTAMDRILLKEKSTLPLTYIIVGIIVGVAIIFVIILVFVLYRRHFKKDDVGSVLDTPDTVTTKTGSYTDTDSSSDKKIRKDADSPSTLMGQLRQGYTKDQYRFSADYDDMPYKEHVNGNNNGYRYIDTSDTYSDQNIYDGEYIRSDLGHTDRYADRIVPLYSPTGGYNLSSFRGDNYNNGTPPPTMSRLTPLHMSNSKLATDV